MDVWLVEPPWLPKSLDESSTFSDPSNMGIDLEKGMME
jgi:hypothetical protein